MSKKPDWITEDEAAKMTNYSAETLRRYCKSGKLPISTTNIKGRSWMYDRKDIEKMLNENATIIY